MTKIYSSRVASRLIILTTVYSVNTPFALADIPATSTSLSSYQQNSTKLAQAIYEIFQFYQISYDIDLRSVDTQSSLPSKAIVGQEALIKKIADFINNQEPILITMIGFPFKSSNQEKKVLSNKPDMAERYSLEYIQSLVTKIQAVYQPGIKFTIISDGSTFNDILGISDADVEAYEMALKTLACDLSGIEIITSKELRLPYHTSLKDLRHEIEQNMPTRVEFEAKLFNDPKLQYELDVIKKRLALEFDHPEGQKKLQKIGTIDPLTEVSKRVIIRSQQFGQFIAKRYQTIKRISFSVHFQKDVGRKFGMKLSEYSHVTPWHGILCQNGRSFQIVHKAEVDLSRYERVEKDVNGLKCSYFKHK